MIQIIENNFSDSKNSVSSNIPKQKLTDIPPNLSFDNEFQIALYQKSFNTNQINCKISEINHNQYAERYLFNYGIVVTIYQISYNKKGKITSIGLLD